VINGLPKELKTEKMLKPMTERNIGRFKFVQGIRPENVRHSY
jgi:hypothetical protein